MKTKNKIYLVYSALTIAILIITLIIHLKSFGLEDSEFHNQLFLFNSLVITAIMIGLSYLTNFLITKKEEASKKLEENEEKLTTIIELSKEWVWELNSDGVFTHSSDLVEKILGYQATEIVGKSKFIDFFEERFIDAANGIFNRQKKFVDVVSLNKNKAGELVWLKHTGFPVFDDNDNTFLGYRGISKDITASKRNQEALKSLSKTFSSISGIEFLNKMCEHISKSLRADIAFVAKLIENNSSVEIIAGTDNGKQLEKISYLLKDTPCNNVIKNKLVFHPTNTQKLYPKDILLKELDIEGYLGTTIFNKQGIPVAILVVLNRKKLHNIKLAQELFSIFRDRISVEFEKMTIEFNLQKNEEIYRNLFNNSPVGMFQSSIDGTKMINCNYHFCKLTGFSANELKNQKAEQLWIDIGKRNEMLELLSYRGTIENFETELKTKNNNRIIVQISATIYKDDDYIEGVVFDVTDKKLTELVQSSIVKSNSFIQQLSSKVIISFLIDTVKELTSSRDAWIINLNPENELFAHTDKSITSLSIIDQEDLDYSISRQLPSINNEKNYLLIPIIYNSSTIACVALCNKGYNYTRTEASQIKIYCENIFELLLRKEAEQKLEENEKNFRTFFDTVENLLFVLDKRGNIVSTNKSASLKLKYNENELLGKSIVSIYPTQFKTDAIKLITKMIEEEGSNKCYLPLEKKNGELLPVELTITSGVWNGENLLFAVANDITKIKESEEKFSKAFHSSPIMMSINSKEDGRFFDVNKTFLNLLEYSMDEIIGFKITELNVISNRSEIDAINNILSKKGSLKNYPQKLLTKNGKTKIGALSINGITINQKEYLLISIADITELKEKEESLAISQKNLLKSQEIAHLGDWSWNIEKNIIRCSKETYRIFEIDESIFPTIETLISVVHPDSLPTLEESIKLANNGTPLKTLNLKILTPNHNIKYVKLKTEIDAENLKYDTLFGTIQDVTQLKIAENSLIESEQHFKSLAENTHDIIVRYNPQHRYMYVNKATLQVTKLKLEDIIGKTNSDLNLQNYLGQLWDEALNKVFETGIFERVTFDWKTEDEVLTFDSRFFPEFDETGVVKSVLVVSRDITDISNAHKKLEEYRKSLEQQVEKRTAELKQANKNLRIEMEKFAESEERFRAIAENVEDTIMRFDKTLIHTYVNPVVEKQTGINALVYLGKTHEDLGFPKELVNIWENALLKVFESKKPNEVEFMLPNKIWIDWSLFPEFDSEGNVTSVVTIGRDITVRKNMELQIEDALNKEKELSRIKTQFISTASHEFRTPLTTVLSSAELLGRYGRNWDENRYQQHIKKISESVDILASLMEETLELTRAESGKIKFNPKMIDLKVLLDNVINTCSVLKLPKHNLQYNYNSEQTNFIVDSNLLTKSLTNILSNAYKYSPEGGKISINTYIKNSNVFISISDEGIGIPKNNINSLFDSFYRAENVEQISGTGLGLAIVKSAIELHKGTIKVESEEGKGTKFTIALPIIGGLVEKEVNTSN